MFGVLVKVVMVEGECSCWGVGDLEIVCVYIFLLFLIRFTVSRSSDVRFLPIQCSQISLRMSYVTRLFHKLDFTINPGN